MLVQILPLAVLADKIRTIALPQHVAVPGRTMHLSVLAFIGCQTGMNHAGRDEAASGALAVCCNLNHVRNQSVYRALHQRTGVLAGHLRIDLIQIQPVLHAHHVIVAYTAMIHLIKATHTTEGVCPGTIVTAGPDYAPLSGSVCTTVEISMLCLNVFNLLAGIRIADALMQSQFSH